MTRPEHPTDPTPVPAAPGHPEPLAVPPEGPLARLQELAADDALGGTLDADEASELAALRRQFPAEAAAIEFDLAEAAHLAGGGRTLAAAVFPAALAASIARDADLVLGGASAGTAAAAASATASGTAAGLAGLSGLTWRGLAVAGWVSAAAGLIAAATLGTTILRAPAVGETAPIVVDPQVAVIGSDGRPPLSYHVVTDPAALRVAAVGEGESRGEVVWSDARQAGLLQIERLPATGDGTGRGDFQYQLWVIDAARPAGQDRVEAGLFDVGGAETVRTLAFRPALPVGRLGGFLVTRSPAGGSTTPDRLPIALSSSPGSWGDAGR